MGREGALGADLPEMQVAADLAIRGHLLLA
jgi:hypothetical protein